MNERSWEVYTQVLSKENLNLIYSEKAETASFNLDTREVILPTFDYMTEETTQLLISHEVGHAYFSDYSKEEFNKYTSLFGDLFNVVEDAHIENRMKKTFGGLSLIFKEGYKILHREKFFDIDRDVSEYSLTSRLNLFYKLGHIIDVPFVGKENEFALALKNVSSKDDVILLCEKIKEYIKDELSQQNEEDENCTIQFPQNGEVSTTMNDSVDEGEDTFIPSEDDKDSSQEEGVGEDKLQKELVDETTENFNKKLSEYGKEQLDKKPQVYSFNSNILSISSKECFNNCYDFTNDYSIIRQKTFYTSKACKMMVNTVKELAKSADTVFQQKKKAEELKSSKNVQVGRLNRKNLSKHLISDNIFKRMKITKEGKNHGIVILVDYSSSMTGQIKDTLIQACILGEFCRMNDIPFSIVAFGISPHKAPNKITALLGHNDNFDIGCIMSLTKQGQGYKMGYTPTVVALGVATYIIDAYMKIGVEKSSLFLITDGFYSNLIVKDDNYVSFNPEQSRMTIDNVLYSMDKIIPSQKRIHNNWIIELMLYNLKKRYNTFVSISFIFEYKKVLNCLMTNTIMLFGYKDELNRPSRQNAYSVYETDRRNSENYLYLWKHAQYFENVSKIKTEVKNGILSYDFKNNPTLDLFQLFDYTSTNEEANLLSKNGNYHKRLKIFVNGFIERFA
jgi:hypothetical protein